MVVDKSVAVFLYQGFTDINIEILKALFQLILDEMVNKYSLVRTSELKIEGAVWIVYYRGEEEQHLAFKKSIEDTFKPGFFVFGEEKQKWTL